MNFFHTLILIAALAAGILGTLKVKELIGSNKTTPTQLRYIACVEQGKESSQCAIDELMLRGLSCRS